MAASAGFARSANWPKQWPRIEAVFIDLDIQPLTRAAFAPFGDVIETAGAEHFPINQGTTERFHDLANVNVADQDGHPLISIFRGQPRPLPIEIRMMEFHPLGTQAFVPLAQKPYLVVVAASGAPPAISDLKAFRANGDQGVNYHRNVWHHPLLVFEPDHEFLVVDRGGEGDNCVEHYFDEDEAIARLVV